MSRSDGPHGGAAFAAAAFGVPGGARASGLADLPRTCSGSAAVRPAPRQSAVPWRASAHVGQRSFAVSSTSRPSLGWSFALAGAGRAHFSRPTAARSAAPAAPIVCSAEEEVPKTLAPAPAKIALWSAYAVYCAWLFLSTGSAGAPGPAAWQGIDPASLKDVTDLSINFFFLMPVTLPQYAPVVNPVYEGLFNFVNAWSTLFGTVLVTDAFSQRRNTGLAFWTGQMFLTNVFYVSYIGLREEGRKLVPPTKKNDLRFLKAMEARWLPVFLAAMGTLSIGWAFAARPEFGGLAERMAYFAHMAGSDRLFHAFLWDIAFYSVFQTWLLADDRRRRGWEPPAALRLATYIPFFGLALHSALRPPLDLPESIDT